MTRSAGFESCFHLVRFDQELILKVFDIEATSERVVSSSRAYHELVLRVHIFVERGTIRMYTYKNISTK